MEKKRMQNTRLYFAFTFTKKYTLYINMNNINEIYN